MFVDDPSIFYAFDNINDIERSLQEAINKILENTRKLSGEVCL